eukprot:TRINITY_DN2325_c0_g1_i4.p1 TRINITY_DN2325_c0_g1~~TRINITY_DN2325_c0_g1_i4.p1  ORF type:complete len:658 (+),score=161.18 TRINITY_DN2325_c0_g1_i4:50-1975(+)
MSASARDRAETAAKQQYEELCDLRRSLAARDVECAKLEQSLSIERHQSEQLRREVNRKERSIEVVMKELMTKKQEIDKLQKANEDLRAELRVTNAEHRTATLLQDRELRMRERGGQGSQRDNPAARFMSVCFESSIDPDPFVLRSLYDQGTVSSAKPLSLVELEALSEILGRGDQQLSIQQKREFNSYRLQVADEEGYPIMAELIRGNPALTSVEISGVTDRGLRLLLPALEQARKLSLLRMPRPGVLKDDTVQGIVGLFQRRAQAATAHRHTAQGPASSYLKIEELQLARGDLLASTLESLQMDTLRRLDLSRQPGLCDGVVEQIVAHCRNLTGLSVAGADRITQRFIAFMNKHGERVTELDVSGCKQLDVLSFDHVQRLHTDLSRVRRVRCPELLTLPRTLGSFPVVEMSCRALRHIALHGVSAREREFKLLGDGAPNLVDLSLTNCSVQDLGLLLGRLRRLRRLILRDTSGVRDADLRNLSSVLEGLDLTGCYYLTDDVMDKVTARCTGLRYISLARVSNVTDFAADLLGERCEGLVTVNLLGCKKVGALAVDRLVGRCPSIETVFHDEFRSVRVGGGADPAEEDLSRAGGTDVSAADVLLDFAMRAATPGGLRSCPHTSLLPTRASQATDSNPLRLL